MSNNYKINKPIVFLMIGFFGVLIIACFWVANRTPFSARGQIKEANTADIKNGNVQADRLANVSASNQTAESGEETKPSWFNAAAKLKAGEKCKPYGYDGQQHIYLPRDEFKKNYGSERVYKTCYVLQNRLIEAAREGENEKVLQALRDGAHIEGTYSESHSALWAAAAHGREDTVKLLLEQGAQINRTWTFGKTALTAAIFKGDAGTVKVLLEKGAAVCGSPETETTPLQISRKQKFVEITDLLIKFGADKCSSKKNE